MQTVPECEEERERLRQDALAAFADYQGTRLHVTGEEADASQAKLEVGEDAPAPECHV